MLLQADAFGRVPTPLDDITAALKLGPVEPLFDETEVPAGLLATVRRLAGTVLGALAIPERIVFIDRTQPRGRQRFTHGHEIGHDVLPWHADAYFGDDENALRAETSNELEAEVHCFSSDLNFQLDRFSFQADDYALSLHTPLTLADEWDMSRHATIRRYVEFTRHTCGLVVLGRFTVSAGENGTALKVLQGLESVSFRQRFGPAINLFPTLIPIDSCPVAVDAYAALTGCTEEPVTHNVCSLGGAGAMEYDVFFNQFTIFVLFYPRKVLRLGRRVRAEWAQSATGH